MSEGKEYKAKSLTIKNPVQIRFAQGKPHRWLRSKPDWFVDAYELGTIQVTNNEKDKYLIVYNKDEDSQKVRQGSWLICSSRGRIYAMTDTEFKEAFEAV